MVLSQTTFNCAHFANILEVVTAWPLPQDVFTRTDRRDAADLMHCPFYMAVLHKGLLPFNLEWHGKAHNVIKHN